MGIPDGDAFGREWRLDRLISEKVEAPAGWERTHVRGLSGSALESPVFQSSICSRCRVMWPCDTALMGTYARDGRTAALRMR
jgi:hypothetical protein